jgi:hypothetical protein
MKAIFTGLILTILTMFSGFSQELTIKYGEQVVNNDSIYLSGNKLTELLEFQLSITNNRDVAVSLKTRKTEIFTVDGTEVSFCWGECYTPAVFVSPMVITIQPGATDTKSFIGDCRPFGAEGTSIVKFSFFQPSEPAWEVGVTIFFQIGVSGINPSGLNPLMITASPNPADHFIRVSWPEDAGTGGGVTLMNLQGQTLITQIAVPGSKENVLSVASLPAGMYFISVIDDKGRRFSKKVCISR